MAEIRQIIIDPLDRNISNQMHSKDEKRRFIARAFDLKYTGAHNSSTIRNDGSGVFINPTFLAAT